MLHSLFVYKKYKHFGFKVVFLYQDSRAYHSWAIAYRMFRIRLDPYHFGLSWSGEQKISQNHGKFQQKSQEYHTFCKNIKFFLTEMNFHLMNNKTSNFLRGIIDRKNFFFRLVFSWFLIGSGAVSGSRSKRNRSEILSYNFNWNS